MDAFDRGFLLRSEVNFSNFPKYPGAWIHDFGARNLSLLFQCSEASSLPFQISEALKQLALDVGRFLTGLNAGSLRPPVSSRPDHFWL